jgi:hypothetical protein
MFRARVADDARGMKTPIPRWRSMAAWSIRGLGIAIGAALGAAYLLLMWESPPEIDWPHARLRSVMGLYLLFPLLLLAGPIWLFDRIAAFVAPMPSANKKDRETDL